MGTFKRAEISDTLLLMSKFYKPRINTTLKSHLLENFEDSFEKKVDGLELSAEVSCDEVGIPAYGARVRFLVIPE